MLEVRITKKLEQFCLNVEFSCPGGKLLALIGPSGAGKTTLLRIIAGLERPDSGRIILDGRTWVDTEKNIFLPPQKRGLGYVFQEFILFPHLSIAENVAFSCRDKRRVEDLLKMFAIHGLRHRRPHQLSGGERQRVALAQAVASSPCLLLLDEPFSALDVVTKESLRNCLNTIKNRFTLPIVHVTHDLQEASILADRLLPIEKGLKADDWLGNLLAGKVHVLSHGINASSQTEHTEKHHDALRRFLAEDYISARCG